MNILLCSPLHITGGISHWTNNVIDYFNDRTDLNVSLHWFYPMKNSQPLQNKSTLMRILLACRNYLPFLRNIGKQISNNNIDAVHLSSSGSLGLLRDYLALKVCKKYKVKSVIHFHFGRIPEIVCHKNWEYNILKKVINLADKVIVLDKASYRSLKSIGCDNAIILPNPLSHTIKKIISENNRDSHSLNTILFAGHMITTKGIRELVEACKCIPNIELRMLGACDNNTKTELYNIGGESSSEWLEILGNQPLYTVIEEMLRCTIFALPTYTEGFPNVIIESMACGCPIVTTPVGAIPEMLDINTLNECGICVPVGDVISLRSAIENLLKDRELAKKLSSNAINKVNSVYSIDMVMNRLLNVWETIESN